MKCIDILTERYLDIASALVKYKDRADIFVSFTDVHKLGVNPRSSFDTPLGIYAYPLREMFEAVVSNTVPFAGDRQWCVVFAAQGNTLDVNPDGAGEGTRSYTAEMWQRDADVILTKYLPLYTRYHAAFLADERANRFDTVRVHELLPIATQIQQLFKDDPKVQPMFSRSLNWAYTALKHNVDFDAMLEENWIDPQTVAAIQALVAEADRGDSSEAAIKREFAESIRAWSSTAKLKTPTAQMWNVTRSLASAFAKLNSNRSSVIWTSMLRALGYDGFTDRTGSGLIHQNEPTQAVFFSFNTIRLIEILPNIRKAPVDYTPMPRWQHLIARMTNMPPSMMDSRMMPLLRNLLNDPETPSEGIDAALKIIWYDCGDHPGLLKRIKPLLPSLYKRASQTVRDQPFWHDLDPDVFEKSADHIDYEKVF